ncbi:MAG: hypothetical protein ACI9XP_001623 [Lentimonas sp.]|jgi:hypothetical protein
MKKILFLLFSLQVVFAFAQTKISGQVIDELGLPIPGVKVFVQKGADLRTIADQNGYFEMFLNSGEYTLVIDFPGYERRSEFWGVENTEIHRILELSPLQVQDLQDMEVSTKRTNPGREIILKVIERRDTISQWAYPHKVEVYTRATDINIERPESDRKQQRRAEKATKDSLERVEKEAEELLKSQAENQDTIQKDLSKKELASIKEDSIQKALMNKPPEVKIPKMNMVEVQMLREFSPPNDVKETRNAYLKKGRDYDLYYTTTVKTNFDFFQNLMRWDDLHEVPIISPISGPGILSYKYRLVAQYEEDGQKIHKIEIIPRGSSTSSLAGYIYVIDSIWMIQKLDLSLKNGSLLYHDYFSVMQEYDNLGDSLNVLTKQVLNYGIKVGSEDSKGRTLTTFENYEFNVVYPEKYFGNELAVTTQEAYDKDSTFWEANRKLSLTEDEKEFIRIKDSVDVAHMRVEYLDSVDSVYNRINLLEVLVEGIGYRNRETMTRWYFPSVLSLVNFFTPGGIRYSANVYYNRRWENQKAITIAPDVSFGPLNKDLKGKLFLDYLYDPMHIGHFGAEIRHDFDQIRSYDAITQVLFRNNYIEKTELAGTYSRELVNGLYLNGKVSFSERRDISDYKFSLNYDSLFGAGTFDVEQFKPYQGLFTKIDFTWVPGQKYMREPYRKVVLGSKWPTFSAGYERGIPKVFGSDIDYEYLLLTIGQSFKIGTIGTSKYRIKSGKFLSARELYVVDYKYQRRSDPGIFSNPLNSFQNLQVLLPTNDIYYEGHFIHHDNGAIVNKIPFMKKTGLGVAFGGGAMYVPEFKHFHSEIFAGVERNFRIFGEKIRFGLYIVATEGNTIKPNTTFKIGITPISRFSSDWDY